MDTRFFYRLFSRPNSLDYTRRCSHPRDYLAGAAINGPPLILTSEHNEVNWIIRLGGRVRPNVIARKAVITG